MPLKQKVRGQVGELMIDCDMFSRVELTCFNIYHISILESLNIAESAAKEEEKDFEYFLLCVLFLSK